jgi:hypothetical protein
MTYDQPDDGFEPIEPDEPEFCLIHGYAYMMDSPGNPIPWCAECEKERAAHTESANQK